MENVKRINSAWYLAGLIVVLAAVSLDAKAIPAFARKSNISCNTCHSAWPALNKVGRSYKENGYRFEPLQVPDIQVTDYLKWDVSLPVSVVFTARPYDKTDTGEAKMRALHEVELIVGGPMGENMSGYFEIESEDEYTNNLGLDVSVPYAHLTFNQSDALNLQMSYGGIMGFDPYNTFTDTRRLTRGSLSILGGFGGADNGASLLAPRQNITAYGRPIHNFFYGVGISGSGDDSVGERPETYMGRIAFDITPDVMIGLLGVSGTCTAEATNICTVDRDFIRAAIDVQATINNDVTITAVFMDAKDDNATAVSEENNQAMYIQALYVNNANNRADWAPLIRFDTYERLDGVETINEVTVGLNYYFSDNVRGMFEYWDRQGDGTVPDDNRVTFQLLAAF